MKFATRVVVAAKRTPVKAWVAAIILPGGLIALSAWVVTKSVYKVLRKKNKQD